MAEMKGIKLCGECINYDWKKHKCKIGCNDDSDAQAPFYGDCPLPDVVPKSEGENISQMHPSDEFICEKCGLIIRECCRYEIDEDDGDEICYEFPYRFCPRCGMKVKGESKDA